MKQLILLFTLAVILSQPTTAQNTPSYVPTNGLVGWWPFNGNANDESGNGNNGLLSGGNFIQDRNGIGNSAVELLNLNDLVSTSSSIPPCNGFHQTISFWCKIPTQYNHSSLYWINSGNIYTNGFFVAIDQNDGVYGANNYTLVYNIGLSSTARFITNQSEFGAWNHITTVYDSTIMKIYLNGILRASQSYSSGINSPNGHLEFADWNNPTTPNTSGRIIDDIGIWNRALTQQEIANLYNASTPATTCPTLPSNLQSGLVGYWPFCGNANDESGNGNDGTVNGAILSADRNGNPNSSYYFNGISNYIELGNISGLNSNQGISSSGWIKYGGPNGTLDGQYAILIAPNPNLSVTIGDNYILTANVTNCNCSSDIGTASQTLDTNWHHFAITYELQTGTSKLFIDAILTASSGENIFSYYTINNSNSRFGNYHFNSFYYKGYLDDICIWNRALSAAEVSQLYAAQSVNPTNNSSSSGNGNSVATNFPSGISYQAVARDSVGQSLSNTPLTVRFTLRDSSISGTAVYTETHTITTNSLGLFTAVIGSGTPVQGTYSSINWMGPQKFLSVEINSGSGFQLIGNQQLLSVPYANAADKASKIKNASLPVYTDNAAATVGGLQPGDSYRTPTGVFMIVY